MVTSAAVALPAAQAQPSAETVAETSAEAIAVATDASALELRRIRRLLMLSFLLALFTAVYFARDVLLPIVLAVVLTLTLLPVVRWGERLGVPNGVTAVLVLVGMAGAIFAAGYVLSGPVGQLVEDAPRIAEAARERMDTLLDSLPFLRQAAEQATGVATDAAQGAAAVAGAPPSLVEPGAAAQGTDLGDVVGEQGGLIAGAVGGLASAGGSVAAALVLMAFLLAAGDFYHRRIVEAAPRLRDKKKALTIIRDVERQISRYLGAITLINLGLGLSIAAAMWALGMPSPLVWGALGFLLNYIPFVGNILTVGLVAAVGFVTFDTLWASLLPPLAVIALSGLESQLVTPLVVGRRLELNQVSQLIMVAFWTWLWGVPGAILAVPFLVVVKAVCDNVESLQKLGSFLSGDPATQVGEAPGKATTGPALETAPFRTQAEAREESPPTVAPGEERITPLAL